MEKIVMGTSLAPFDYDKQIECLDTWIKSGFEVISFNSKREIEVLAPHFAKMRVTFYEISRNAQEMTGKPLPYICDILKVVSEKSNRICGYFNSDILMQGVTEPLYRFIFEEALDSLVFVRRNEISEPEDVLKVNWQMHFDGIDVFFLDKKYADLFQGDDFFVQSVWDLFILEKCRMNSIKIKELMNPVAFHRQHSIKWNFGMANRFAEAFESKYYGTITNSYERALNQFYVNLFQYVEKICYCSDAEKKCLFIAENHEDTRCSIHNQEDVSTTIQGQDNTAKNTFDYLIYVKGNAIFDKVFCKLLVYLMEWNDLQELSVGRFFVSEVEGKDSYNKLNRNLSNVREINEKGDLYTTVCRNGSGSGKKAKLLLPVMYERIDINNHAVVEKRKISGDVYIIPSGVRAYEWYKLNHYRLKEITFKGFLDNNLEKVGKYIEDKKIYHTEDILQAEHNFFVVLASKYYNTEIKNQLIESMDERKIIDAGYIMQIDEDGYVYSFVLEKYCQNNK